MVSTFTPASAASLAIVRPFIPSLRVIAAACRDSTVRTLVQSQEVFCAELNTALCLLAGIVINRWQSVPIAENRLHVQTSLDVLWCNLLSHAWGDHPEADMLRFVGFLFVTAAFFV